MVYNKIQFKNRLYCLRNKIENKNIRQEGVNINPFPTLKYIYIKTVIIA